MRRRKRGIWSKKRRRRRRRRRKLNYLQRNTEKRQIITR
jgi:hypothetical protein